MTISKEVLEAIETELQYQKDKWGEDKQQSFPGFLKIMEGELEEAGEAWLKDIYKPRQTALEEVVQVVATGIACLEKYGTEGWPVSTDDRRQYRVNDD